MHQPLVALKELFLSHRKFLITAHKSPDGDAVGSVSGLYFLLKNLGRSVEVVLPDPPAKNLEPFLQATDCRYFSEQPELVAERFQSADCFIGLDFNAVSRVGEMQTLVENFSGTKVLIDHHTHPEDFADILISEVQCSSTCQLLYECFESMELLLALQANAARALYLGIMTDTGSFRFPSVNANTHRIVASLIGYGTEPWKIHQAVFDHNRVDQLKLRGFAVSEKLILLNQHPSALPVGYIALTQEELQRFNYQSGDTEGLVNTILSIEGIKAGVLIQEKSNGIKMSFRSKDEVYVNNFAKNHFNGGGHHYAAGGYSEHTMDVTITKLLSLIHELF
ncbi:MAG: bifunctional oligoribonuclease/PAP phosphatase NrnA [Flavobacteriia bacterium]|nr:bifunctional oligoribonuclease/PAP phosphatase NrnA [Flavobacteriia bacterium]